MEEYETLSPGLPDEFQKSPEKSFSVKKKVVLSIDGGDKYSVGSGERSNVVLSTNCLEENGSPRMPPQKMTNSFVDFDLMRGQAKRGRADPPERSA